MKDDQQIAERKRFRVLLHKHEDEIIKRWVDALYAEPTVTTSSELSFEQLVADVPDLIDCLGMILDEEWSRKRISDEVRGLRNYSQNRFYQNVLLDEMARELTVLKQVVCDCIWQEMATDPPAELYSLKQVLTLTDLFFSEMLTYSLVIYANNLRPTVPTRLSVWPPATRAGHRENS